jgi:hypothetical protein
MFKTTEATALFSNPVGVDRIQFWSHVEHEIMWPWFYLQIVQEDGDAAFRTMVMLSSTADLASIVAARSPSAWIEKAYLASPGDVNGTGTWQLEPLARAEIIFSDSKTALGARFYIDKGCVRSIGDTQRVSGGSSQVFFCAELHLGRLATTG